MTAHRVLVVDDDSDIREGLLDLLGSVGCPAVGAANGQKALDYLQHAEALPCLILLDLMMPIMDGTAFREEQLRDPRLAQIPVIIVSAYRDIQADAQRLKAVSFLKKPPKMEELLSAVTAHC